MAANCDGSAAGQLRKVYRMKKLLSVVLEYFVKSGLLAVAWVMFAGSAAVVLSNDNPVVFQTVGVVLWLQLLGLLLVLAALGLWKAGRFVYLGIRAYAKNHSVSIPAQQAPAVAAWLSRLWRQPRGNGRRTQDHSPAAGTNAPGRPAAD